MSTVYANINTDRGLGTILSNFESDYIIHLVSDYIQYKFRPFEGNMPNIADIWERQFQNISENTSADYYEQIEEVRRNTYIEMINIVCDHYDLTFTGDTELFNTQQLYFIARNIFDIFIARFTENIINFFTSYISNNIDGIYNYLNKSEDTFKPKETGTYDSKNFVDPKFILVHANTNIVLYNMGSYDIPLSNIISFSTDPNVSEALINLLADNGDFYKNHISKYITDSQYSPSVITNIKLKLQADILNKIDIMSGK